MSYKVIITFGYKMSKIWGFNVYHGEFTVTFKNNIYKSETTNINKDRVEFCKIPRTRAELIEFTGFSRQYTMTAIIQPLVDEGKLNLMMPNKPKSSKQQYVKSWEIFNI